MSDLGDFEADPDREEPTRSEPADFGGGESTGVQDLLGGDDTDTDESDMPTEPQRIEETMQETETTHNVYDESDVTNEDVLRNLYHHKKMSMQDVADALGVKRSKVRYQMEKHSVETRTKQEAKLIAGGAPTLRIGSGGYEHFIVSQNNEKSRVEHHRLLAAAMYGFDEVEGKHVHHKNGIPWDNRPENLEVLTPSEHLRKHRDVTTDSKKLAIWALYESTDYKYREIAEMFDENTSNVGEYLSYVRNGKTKPKVEVEA